LGSEGEGHRRRRSEALRNIDDTLKVMGVLSMKSLSLLFALYGISYALDVSFGVFRLLFGGAGVLVEGLAFTVAALGLAYAERQDDEHLVPAMLRFFADRRSRALYSGARPDGWPHHRGEQVLGARGTPAFSRARPGRGGSS
jgi:hypothetical protein